jgi:cell division protein FtsL
MFIRKNLLGFAILLIVAISVSSCSYESKEVKLEKKRDELVKAKAEAEWWRQSDHKSSLDFSYRLCLSEKAEREEDPKKCEENKETSLKANQIYQQNRDDKVNEIRREIKELEQDGSANKNLSK